MGMKNFYLVLLCIGMMFQYGKAQNNTELTPFLNGDVVFIKHSKLKSGNLIPNGKTKYNYVGVIFMEDGIPMVYHATEPISKTHLEAFIDLSEGRDYKIKRLSEQNLLNTDVIQTMHTFAKAKLHSHYDGKLSLTNDELYNSEFVYKMYQHALGIKLSEPKPLADLKNDPLTLDFLKEAYGDQILNEKMVVLGDLYHSIYME
jgi:hypothetical protein